MAIRRSNGTLGASSITPTLNQLIATPKAVRTGRGRATDNGPLGGSVATTTTPLDYDTAVTTPFSTADVLNARYQAAYNNGNVDLANIYKTLNQENNSYNRVANQISDYYNALAQDISQREQGLAGAKYDVANKLFNDMASQRDYVYGLYGPQGTFTKEINTYYDDMGDYLASEAGREMAYADAMGVQSGASLGMMRAQRNQAYNEAFQRSLQVMQAELEAKQNVQQNLINFMTSLRQEYGDTANTYIISQYERANNLLNTISQNIATTQANIAAARLSSGGSGSSSSSEEEDEATRWNSLNGKERVDQLSDPNSRGSKLMSTIGISNYDIENGSLVGTTKDGKKVSVIGSGTLASSNINPKDLKGTYLKDLGWTKESLIK